jgi:hypothetical protein
MRVDKYFFCSVHFCFFDVKQEIFIIVEPMQKKINIKSEQNKKKTYN